MKLPLKFVGSLLPGVVLILSFITRPVYPGFSQQISNASATKKTSTESVLSEGKWYKLAISVEGIYKIDYEFLQSIGVDPAQVNPSTIRIFGNGGKMLPQSNSEFRYDGLQENAIYEKSNGSGFSPDDYIAFFGQGPDTHNVYMDSGEVNLDYQKNIYSDSSYYFFIYGDEQGKRIENRTHLGMEYPRINSFIHVEIHETDQFNLVDSGREWYGEKFDLVTSQDFEFDVSGIESNTILKIKSVVMAKSRFNSSFQLDANGITIGKQDIGKIPDGTYSLKGRINSETFEINSSLLSMPDNTLHLRLTYDKPSEDSRSAGYLDYFNLICERDLRLYDQYTFFRYDKRAKKITIVITSINNPTIII